jgi:hypothetical protein
MFIFICVYVLFVSLRMCVLFVHMLPNGGSTYVFVCVYVCVPVTALILIRIVAGLCMCMYLCVHACMCVCSSDGPHFDLNIGVHTSVRRCVYRYNMYTHIYTRFENMCTVK